MVLLNALIIFGGILSPIIFLGDEKKEIISSFINDCYISDGEKKEIKKKLLKVGYKLPWTNNCVLSI